MNKNHFSGHGSCHLGTLSAVRPHFVPGAAAKASPLGATRVQKSPIFRIGSKIILVGVASFFCLATTALGGEPTRWPYPSESGRYQVRRLSDNAILWTIDWTAAVTQAAGRKQIQVTENGHGKIPKYKQPVKWVKQFLFEELAEPLADSSGISFLEMKTNRSAQTGGLLDAATVTRVPNGIDYRDSEAGKKEKRGHFPAGTDIFPDELLFHWARTVPREQPLPQAVREAVFLLSAGRSVAMQAQIKKMETVTTPAGRFRCYRIELSPKIMGALKMFAPAMTLWCRQEWPHEWVRYEGPVGGGPTAPKAVIELTEWSHK